MLYHIRAEIFEVFQRALFGAFAQRHYRDHGGDAEDDAGHGQRGAQTMSVHRLQRHVQRFASAVDQALPAARLRFGGGNDGPDADLRPLSAMILPSCSSMTRCACCATFISCVTITTVGRADSVRSGSPALPGRIGCPARRSFVRQDDLTAVDQRTGDADALLLAAESWPGLWSSRPQAPTAPAIAPPAAAADRAGRWRR